MEIEICAGNLQSALNAQKGGADRIELCSELSVGGITPSYGIIKEVLNHLKIPVFVLIRPRGGDFVYSEEEFSAMMEDIKICKELGCAGIVSGVLKEDFTIDLKRTRELIELSKPLEFTFHRAFDRVKDPEKSLRDLIELKVDRILTSGQESTAEKGLGLLTKLKELSGNRLTILPGGGIQPENVHLFKEAGFTEVHASVSSPVESKSSKSKFFGTVPQMVSDLEKIKELVERFR